MTKTPSLRETSPSWSPDGQARMAFVAQSSSGELGVHTLAVGRAAIRRYVEALEERPLVDPLSTGSPSASSSRPYRRASRSFRSGMQGQRPAHDSARVLQHRIIDQSPRHGIVVAGVGFSFIGLNPSTPRAEGRFGSSAGDGQALDTCRVAGG